MTAGLPLASILNDDFDFDLLTEEEAAEYIQQLESAIGDVWALTPKQLFAEEVGNVVDWLLFGGAAGAGKSELSCYHANRLSLEVPGHVSLMLRRSIPELRRSLIIRLIARIGKYSIPAKYRKLDGQAGFQYKNTSLIECGHMQTEESIAKYLGSEYDLIVIDESTTLTDEQIIQVQSRLRTTKEKAKLGARPHLWLLTNPGGMSHAWHYDMFITPTYYGQKIIVYDVTNGLEKRFVTAEYEAPCNVAEATDQQIVDVLLPWVRNLKLERDPSKLVCAFVPARATQNPHLDPNYLRSLNTLSERRRRQLRDGDWDTFEGMYFHEWRKDLHVVDPFPIPPSWQRARGIDFGSTNPYSCHWCAWDENGDAWIYREDYAANLTPQEQARRVIDRSVMEVDGLMRPEKFWATVADPSVFSNHRGAGKTIADMWADSGLRVTRAKNDRIGGWTNVRQYLWDYAANNGQGGPRLHVFSTCTNLVRTFPLMQHDSHKVEDMNTTGEDHALDSTRYVLATRPISSDHRRNLKPVTADERFGAMLRKLDKRKRPR